MHKGENVCICKGLTRGHPVYSQPENVTIFPPTRYRGRKHIKQDQLSLLTCSLPTVPTEKWQPETIPPTLGCAWHMASILDSEAKARNGLDLPSCTVAIAQECLAQISTFIELLWGTFKILHYQKPLPRALVRITKESSFCFLLSLYFLGNYLQTFQSHKNT